MAEENIVVTNNNQTKTVNTINGLEIAGNYLLGFCATLHYLLPNATTGNIEEFNHTLHEGFKQKTLFEKILLTSIGTILLLLLINFFLFTHYFDKTEELNESLALNRTSIETITKLKDHIKEKEQRLKSFTGNTNSKSSFLLNEIVRRLPYSIILTEIDFYPLEKKIKPDEPVITKDHEIIISGTSLNNEDFTRWVEVTGKLSRIGKVTILNFGKDQENNTIFSVKIALKP
jgi:Tfp pilus assembly protein PilN